MPALGQKRTLRSQADFAKFIVDFIEKWRKVIRAANIKPEYWPASARIPSYLEIHTAGIPSA
jgi:hypothetical protein